MALSHVVCVVVLKVTIFLYGSCTSTLSFLWAMVAQLSSHCPSPKPPCFNYPKSNQEKARKSILSSDGLRNHRKGRQYNHMSFPQQPSTIPHIHCQTWWLSLKVIKWSVDDDGNWHKDQFFQSLLFCSTSIRFLFYHGWILLVYSNTALIPVCIWGRGGKCTRAWKNMDFLEEYSPMLSLRIII